MSSDELINEIEILNKVANRDLPSVNFLYERFCRDSENRPFCEWCLNGWPRYMPDKESGIYFFRWPKDEVIYIGKATTANLGAEIWGKFGKPTKVENERLIFKSNKFLSNMTPELSKEPELQNAIRQGEIFVTTVTVNPPQISSFIEVYLQTVYSEKMNGNLPKLNKRIG